MKYQYQSPWLEEALKSEDNIRTNSYINLTDNCSAYGLLHRGCEVA